MGLPAGVDKVTLSGTFTDATGAAAAGTVIITPSTQVVDTVDGQIIHDGPMTVTLDATGHYSVTVCASDAANVSPSGFTYTIAVDLAHVAFPPISVLLPKARPAVDHSELVAVPASAGTVVAPQNVLSVNGHTGAVTLAAADVGADAAGAATAAQSNAESYTDTKTLVVKKATGTINTWLTDPQIVPVFESQFVAEAATVRATVRATGRGSGTAGGTVMLGVCNATVGRRPRPFTQSELTTPPAGINYYYIGVVAPNNETLDLTTSPQGYGNQSTVYRDVILTGLTVGATYYLDVTAGIVGGADTIAIKAEAHAYYDYTVCAVPTASGTNKAYVGYSATGGGVQVVNVNCMLPYTPMSNGALIATGPVVHLAATPDHTKVVVATSTPSVQVIATATDTVTATYAISPYANQVVIAPNSATAWLLRSNNTVVPMTIATGALGTAITLTGNPAAGVVSPDGTKLWVCQDSGSNLVRTFNTADGSSAGADLPAAAAPTAICITPDGSKVYVAAGGVIYEIATSTRTVTRAITFAGANVGTPCIALFPGDTPRTLLVWTNAAAATAIYQIDLIDWTVYTSWGCLSGGNAGFAYGCLTSTGDILAADFTNARLNHWQGGSVAFDTASANTFLHAGEGVEITCTPAT